MKYYINKLNEYQTENFEDRFLNSITRVLFNVKLDTTKMTLSSFNSLVINRQLLRSFLVNHQPVREAFPFIETHFTSSIFRQNWKFLEVHDLFEIYSGYPLVNNCQFALIQNGDVFRYGISLNDDYFFNETSNPKAAYAEFREIFNIRLTMKYIKFILNSEASVIFTPMDGEDFEITSNCMIEVAKEDNLITEFENYIENDSNRDSFLKKLNWFAKKNIHMV